MLNENYRAEFKPKARVVAHGFEDKSLNESEKETSTCSKDTFSTAVGLAIKNNWDIQAVDIKTAFLQGENTDWDNFVIPPPEANCPKRDIWKLNKCIYGLTDASLKWYSRMKFTSKSGSMVWSKWQFARIYSRSCWWFSLCRKWQFSQVNYKKVETAFLINKEDKLNFKYLRLNVTWNNNNITLNQFEYIQNLQEVNIPASRKNILTSTLGKEEKDISPVKIGQLFWISNQIGY